MFINLFFQTLQHNTNVSILGTQIMNLGIGYIIILVDYQTTWSQLVTPIIPSKTNMLPTSTYPM
jgi:hypothetical protein